METLEYADYNNLLEEPAFKWWSKKVLKRKDIIISRFKSRYRITIHKFGITLTHFVEEAYYIYEKNGNNFWQTAIDKELKRIQVTKNFEMMEGVEPEDIQSQKNPMPGYKEIGYHIIFNIKMNGKFTQKSRLVENGHGTEYAPKQDTYSSMVSRDSVRI